MLILAHAGITLGAATLLAVAVKNRHSIRGTGISWLGSLSSYIDIRFLIIGALLPDIIDKPVGQYIFRETFANGRIYAHTLLFLIVISAAGFYLYKRRRQVWLLTLSAGTFMHLLLDRMWQAPATLFWPLMGFSFKKGEITDWAGNMLQRLISEPSVYIPEAIGLAIIMWFGLAVVFRKKTVALIKYGKAL